MRTFYLLFLIILANNCFSQTPSIIYEGVPIPNFKPIKPINSDLGLPQYNRNYKPSIPRKSNVSDRITYKLISYDGIDEHFNTPGIYVDFIKESYISISQSKVIVYIPEFDINLTLYPKSSENLDSGIVLNFSKGNRLFIFPKANNLNFLLLVDEQGGLAINSIRIQ